MRTLFLLFALAAPDTGRAQSEIETCPPTLAGLPAPYAQDPRIGDDRLIVVFKRAELIGLYERGALAQIDDNAACYPIALGSWPYEAKYRRDYSSTPEGWYDVEAKRTSDPSDEYEHTNFGWSLAVSYPNPEDIRRAGERGTLNDIGGGILIHAWNVSGGPTLGCVGVDEQNMHRLFSRVERADPILLLPWSLVLYQDGSHRSDRDVPELKAEIYAMESAVILGNLTP